MGNMIGILSTVILVGTLATLIFAVGAYVMARRRRSKLPDAGEIQELAVVEPPVVATGMPAAAVPSPAAGAESAPNAAPSRPAAPAAEPTAPGAAPPAPTAESAEPKSFFRRLTPHGEETIKSETTKPSGWEWE